ncbi:MAG: carbohydrate kinase family protein [Planctomycetota bacterium]|jgi:sugar/nucleoside kinase (ribokinase family)
MGPLNVDPARRRYRALIGTGGIGSGVFFALNSDHTLGREESRSGHFLDRNDYCKLHIIAHYVRTLMGPDFATLPIGMVGDDDAGRRLWDEMEEAGLDLHHVRLVPGEQTLYSFCFIYPDGSGGNLTTDDSASAKVSASLVREAETDFAALAGEGIALAVPEVPLEARMALLELATQCQFMRAASFTTEEMAWARASGMFEKVDLLAANIDEAAAAAGVPNEQTPAAVAEAATQALRKAQPSMQLCITAGTRGSWAWDGERLTHSSALEVEGVSTAGAGDAHFAGVLAGLASGLPLAEAQELAVLVAALSVTSPHTINKEIGRESLLEFAARLDVPLSAAVRGLLEV